MQQGMQLLEAGQMEGAFVAAKHALIQLPDFPPALEFAQKAFMATGHNFRANRIRKKLAALQPSAGDMWVCSACGHAAQEWQAHCPNCEAFDTLEWKKRETHFSD